MAEVNKKIMGAKKSTVAGINFDSMLEASCYKHLLGAGLVFKYNEVKFTLLPEFRLDRVYLYDSTKRRSFSMQVTKAGLKRKFTSVTYTPDFTRDMPGEPLFIIETKGFPNDVYPYKKKMLLHKLGSSDRDVYFFEPKNVKEVKETIIIIQNILNGIT